ncbi:hypothetical protein RRG08_063890 [Elysia crispata]|uniref:Uncharacterized protein n=1 Tax=Elysia crispata TaxID=231223 RepID=A0AAE1B9D9_9GAST|nr:hypothetical protein RRG08_063890 [Elysia crispata]
MENYNQDISARVVSHPSTAHAWPSEHQYQGQEDSNRTSSLVFPTHPQPMAGPVNTNIGLVLCSPHPTVPPVMWLSSLAKPWLQPEEHSPSSSFLLQHGSHLVSLSARSVTNGIDHRHSVYRQPVGGGDLSSIFTSP